MNRELEVRNREFEEELDRGWRVRRFAKELFDTQKF